MGTYAEIVNGKVSRVLVVDGTEDEAKTWLLLNVSKNKWITTDVRGKNKNKYAGKGDEYHADVDKFISKKPFDSWTIDKERGMYIPPLPKPLAVVVGYVWKWSVKLGEWVQVKLGVEV